MLENKIGRAKITRDFKMGSLVILTCKLGIDETPF